MKLREWLNTECKPEEIAYLDEEKKIAYIPIGIIENILDELRGFDIEWQLTNFKFSSFKSGNTTFVSGSVELELCTSGCTPLKRVGAATLPVYTRDENKDYEGTILSMCVSNAAKKFGKRFGRHLNGRMEVGETAVKPKPEPEINRMDERFEKMIDDCKSLEELGAIKKQIDDFYKDGQPEHIVRVYAKKAKGFV
jgi:hypothetical protein